jgi:hypothetical protein
MAFFYRLIRRMNHAQDCGLRPQRVERRVLSKKQGTINP